MAIVTIIGAGMMGSAMCWPASDCGHEVRLVGTPLDEKIITTLRHGGDHLTLARAIPTGVKVFQSDQISEALQNADLIIGGVSSFGVSWFAQAVGPYLKPDVPVISVTKGLEDQPNGDLLILPDVLQRAITSTFNKTISFNAIGGPCIAHELAARRQTGVVFCGQEAATLKHLRDLLSTPYYHIWTSTDITSVEVCAALKNAYALAVGLAVGMMEQAGPDGLANMYNPQAALFGQSCYEMTHLLKVMQADPACVSWLPGAGDLYVTVFGGRTVRLGKLLGQGIPFSEARQILSGVTLESVEIATRVARALPKLADRGLADLRDFPILRHLDDILNRAEPVNIPWDSFFRHFSG